jgi:chorismate mutase
MPNKTNYFVLKERAVPEVLLKVVEAKRLLDSGKTASVQEATDAVGISRSSFYKYKDDIFPFHENEKGKPITLVIQLDDEPGLLSNILRAIDKFKCNILTIHQSIPINGIATLTLSVDVFQEIKQVNEACEKDQVDALVSAIEQVEGVHYAKIIARE